MTKKRLSFIKKIFSVYAIFGMIATNILPAVLLSFPQTATANIAPSISTDLTLNYDVANDYLHIAYPNDNHTSPYLLTYQHDGNVSDAVNGDLQDRDGDNSNEEDDVYLGTMSTGGTPSPHDVSSGTVVLTEATDYVKRQFVIDSDLLWYQDTTDVADDTYTLADTFDFNSQSLASALQLNQTVYYPQDHALNLTFTRLPSPAGTITIREIALSEAERQDLDTDSEVMYEITSDMTSDTFTYNLNLPMPESESESLFVRFAPSKDDLLAGRNTESHAGNSLTGMTHFTVFVVSNSAAPTPTPTMTPTPTTAPTPTPTPTPANPHLLIDYHFNSCDSTTAVDSSGHGNNASLVNIEKIGGYSAQGILVNDIHDSVVFSTPVNLGTEHTVSAFVNFAKADDGLTFETSHGVGYGVRYSGGHLEYRIGASPWVDSGYTPDTGRWYHVAFTKENAIVPPGVPASTLKFYVDGQNIRTSTIPWPFLPDLALPVTLYRIGNNSSLTSSGSFATRVDELKLYDLALTDVEMASEFSSYAYAPTNCLVTPTNLGFNIRSQSSNSGERPVDVACGGATNGDYPTYHNGRVAHNWEASGNPAGVKYHRQWQYPNSNTWAAGETQWSQDHTDYRTFGSSTGTEGNWNTRVRSWFDVDGNGQLDESIDDVSAWSNECHVTYDRHRPRATITTPHNHALIAGDFTVEGTASDSLSGIESIRVRFRRTSDNHLMGTFWASYDDTHHTWTAPIHQGDLPDGNYRLIVRVMDQAGNLRWRHRNDITIDNTAPATPTGLRRLAPDEGNQVYTCGDFSKIQRMWPDWNDNTETDFDHYEYTSFNAPNGDIGLHQRVFHDSIFQYNGSWLPHEGTYGFAVRAVDQAGNKSDWALSDETLAGSCQITYDDTAPNLTVEAVKYDDGTVEPGKFKTNDSTPKILGSVSDNYAVDTVKLTVAGHTYDAIINSGQWEAVVTDSLTDGNHTLTVVATDQAGNSTTVNQDIFIDTDAPTAELNYYKDGRLVHGFATYYQNGKKFADPVVRVNDLSRLSFDGQYTDQAPSAGLYWDSYVVFQAQDDGSFAFSQNGKQAYCSWRHSPNLVDISAGSIVGGLNVFNLTQPQSFDNCTSTLPEGEYYLAHQVYDQATRQDIPSINQFRDVLGLHFIIDTTRPVITLDSPTDGLITNQPIEYRAHTNETMNNLNFVWKQDGQVWDWHRGHNSGVDATSYQWDFTPSADGVYQLRAQGHDLAGNWARSSAVEVTYDTTTPSSIITTYNLPNGGETETNSFDGLIEGTATDATSGVDHVLLSIQHSDYDGSNLQYWDATSSAWTSTPNTFDANGTNTWNYQLSDVPEGVYQVSSHAVDRAGNVEHTYTIKVIYDKTIPEVNLTVAPSNPDGDNHWYLTQPSVTLTANDNYQVDYIEYQWETQSGSWTTYSAPITVPTQDQHALYYRAVDKVGNISDVGVKGLNWDNTNPDPGPSNLTVSNLSLPTADLSWDAASDAISGIDRYDVSWRLKSDPSAASHGKTVSAGTTSTQLDNLKDGEWEIKVKAIDAAGNWFETLLLYTIGGGVGTAGATTTLTPTPVPLALGGGAGQVLGVATQTGAGNETASQLQGETTNSTGESQTGGTVKGASTSCVSDWTNYLPIILLIVQALVILGVSLLFSGSVTTKHLLAGATTLASILIYYLLSRSGISCVPDSSWLTWLTGYFYLVWSAGETILLRLGEQMMFE